ncbi:MAG: DUF488 domain-containing protein [Magnetococcales bacterium]|nr:DUF488 domain-containing protein [Magnetococcales bacterium]
MAKNFEVSVSTIGFTQKSAKSFFSMLRAERVTTLIDVRLNTSSQLSGFAKQCDLIFFLKELCGIKYVHLLNWAPTQDILEAYKKKEISWDAYQDKFIDLMARRMIERDVTRELLDGGCLLCSEHEPHYCHRRLLVEYLRKNTNLDINVKHLY